MSTATRARAALVAATDRVVRTALPYRAGSLRGCVTLRGMTLTSAATNRAANAIGRSTSGRPTSNDALSHSLANPCTPTHIPQTATNIPRCARLGRASARAPKADAPEAMISANSATDAELAVPLADSGRRDRNSIVPIAAVRSATSATISRRSSRATCSRNSIATAIRKSTPAARNPASYGPSLGGSDPVASVTMNVALTTAIAPIPRPSEGALFHAPWCRLRSRITIAERRQEPVTTGNRMSSGEPERLEAA